MTDPLTLWHKIGSLLFPRRCIDGSWTTNSRTTWRRRRPDGKWEYKQDEETAEQWMDRQI